MARLLLSPVPDLLDTNRAPSAPERVLIRDAISNAQSLMSQLDVEMQETMRKFQKKHDALNRYAKMHKRLLSPERCIPAEILSTIFVHCLPERWEERSVSSLRTKAVPVLLCQVCSYWRSVAISEPKLWASLSITLRQSNSERAAEMANTWLSRAGGLPLSLMVLIEHDKVDMSTHPVTNTLTSYSDRWQHVHLLMDSESINCFSTVKHHLPALETLHIRLVSTLNTDIFEIAPKLHTVHLDRGILSSRMIKLPWDQITRCRTVSLPLYGALELLRQTPNLVECRLSLDVIDEWQACPIEHLPCLRVLFIQITQETAVVLDHLSLPSLCDLHITLTGFLGNGWGLDRHLIPLVSRSACSLRKLVFHLHQANMADDDLVRCLESMPSLVELVLSFNYCKSNLTDYFLDRLTRDSTYMAPNLETIEFDLYKSTCTSHVLAKMIQSRWSKDDREEDTVNSRGACLRTVKLSSVSFQFDSLTNAQFGQLVKEGLHLFITDKRMFCDV